MRLTSDDIERIIKETKRITKEIEEARIRAINHYFLSQELNEAIMEYEHGDWGDRD